MPLISIIVPIYNAEESLHNCIDSILSQTFNDFQLILVNDGSKDKSGDICDEYAKKDCRITTIHTENTGVSSARNKGLDVSSGEFITFVDADDWLECNALAKYVETEKETSSDWIRCCYIKEYQHKKETITIPRQLTISDKTKAEEFLEKNHLYGFLWNSLYRRSLLLDLQFDNDIQWCEDHIFSYQYLLRCKDVTIIPDSLYHYRVNTGNSLSSKIDYIMWTKAKIKLAEVRIELMQGNEEKIKDRWRWCENFITDIVLNSFVHSTYKERKNYRNEFKYLKLRYSNPYLRVYFKPFPFYIVDIIIRIMRKCEMHHIQ